MFTRGLQCLVNKGKAKINKCFVYLTNGYFQNDWFPLVHFSTLTVVSFFCGIEVVHSGSRLTFEEAGVAECFIITNMPDILAIRENSVWITKPREY